MRQVRPSRGWWGIVALAGLWACETARNPGGVQRDVIPPLITLTSSADTQQIASGLQFTVAASDNLGLKDIQLTYTGGYLAQTDTVFNTTVTTFNVGKSITFPANSGAGGLITITGTATDGAGNSSSSTITIFLSNVQALTVTLLQPVPPAVAASGKNIPVQVQARQLGGIATVGFIITPRNAVVDPTTPPSDSLVFTPPATGMVLVKFDSANVSAGNLTTVDSTFALGLPLADSALPKSIVVRGYACDLATARNCAYSQTSTVITGAPRRLSAAGVRAASGGGVDTVVVVAGITRPLPLGGHIADAIYNTTRRELYLTNDALGRVEVFDVATKTFDPTAILTAGPVPWGIALWPADTLGRCDANRIVVADADAEQHDAVRRTGHPSDGEAHPDHEPRFAVRAPVLGARRSRLERLG